MKLLNILKSQISKLCWPTTLDFNVLWILIVARSSKIFFFIVENPYFSGITRLTRLVEPQVQIHVSYSLVLTMSSLQAISLLLMAANSADKALSIAKPLNYSEIVTFKVSYIIYILGYP